MLFQSIRNLSNFIKIFDLFFDSNLSWLWLSLSAPGAGKQTQRLKKLFPILISSSLLTLNVISFIRPPCSFIICVSVYAWPWVCVLIWPTRAYRNLSTLWNRDTSPLHVCLHPLCVSVGIIGMLGSVGEPRGTSVFPESSLRGSCTASSSYARPHAVHLVRRPTFQRGEAGWSETHPKSRIVWRVAVIFVS